MCRILALPIPADRPSLQHTTGASACPDLIAAAAAGPAAPGIKFMMWEAMIAIVRLSCDRVGVRLFKGGKQGH